MTEAAGNANPFNKIRTAQIGCFTAVFLALAGQAWGQPVFPHKILWPVKTDGLVLSLPTGNGVKDPIVAFKPDGSKLYETKLQERGFDTAKPTARFDWTYALWPDGGSFLVSDGIPFVATSISKSSAFTLEARITPEDSATADGTILALESDPNLALILTQNKDAIEMQLPHGTPVKLCAVPGKDTFNLCVSVENGHAHVYLNGAPAGEPIAASGDFQNWTTAKMSIGDNAAPGHPWKGTIEGIAIFDRALSADEIKADTEAYAKRLAKRKSPETIRMKAKLIQKSATPDPKTIAPYVQSLAVFEYEVEKVEDGRFDGKTIHVETWTLMERKKLPIADRPVGQSYELVLQKERDNPWLESQWMTNTLDEKMDADLYYDITPDKR